MNDSTGTPSTPAGWYADPAGSDRLRWWDGTRWTDHLSDAPAAAASTSPAGESGTGTPEAAPAAASVPPVEQTAPAAPAQPAYGQQAPAPQAYGQPAYGQQAFGQPAYGQQPYAQQAYAAPTPPPQVPASTPPFSWQIWVVAALPILTLLGYAGYDFRDYFRGIMAPRPTVDTGYLLLGLLNFAIYGATVVVAYLDWRDLGRKGIVRPFHWAWSFLGSGVYVIGRSVIVRRRIEGTPAAALAPMWVWIGIVVLFLFTVSIKVVDALSTIMQSYPSGRY